MLIRKLVIKLSSAKRKYFQAFLHTQRHALFHVTEQLARDASSSWKSVCVEQRSGRTLHDSENDLHAINHTLLGYFPIVKHIHRRKFRIAADVGCVETHPPLPLQRLADELFKSN